VYEIEHILCPKSDALVTVSETCHRCDYWSRELQWCTYFSGEKTPATIRRGGRIGIRPAGHSILLGEISSREWTGIQEIAPACEGSAVVPTAEVRVGQEEVGLFGQSDEIVPPSGQTDTDEMLGAVEVPVASRWPMSVSSLDLSEIAIEQGLSHIPSDNGVSWDLLMDPLQHDPLHEEPMQDPFNWSITWA